MKQRAMSVPSMIFIPDGLFADCDCDSSVHEEQTQPRRYSDPLMGDSSRTFQKRWDAGIEACTAGPPSQPCRRHAQSNFEDEQEEETKIDKTCCPPRMPRRSSGDRCLSPQRQECCRKTPLAVKSLPPRCPRRLASQQSIDLSCMTSSLSSHKSMMRAIAA